MFARNSELKVLTVQTGMLAVILAIAMLGVACGSGGLEGKYRDSDGTFSAELKDGKAYIAMGSYAVDGTYKIEGNKLIATGDFGMMLPHTVVLTILSDGTLDPPRDTPIPDWRRLRSKD